ncbi:MAG: M3 family oligoendopeptidase [Symbiobacteriaceae bacterium]|nr:M3 family oligoendopeptidase [Symbiobacteriaceae bacterium]
MSELSGLKQTWDLDIFFPGGPESPEYSAYVEQMSQDLQKFLEEVKHPISGVEAWIKRLDTMQKLSRRNSHARAFISCHGSADTANQAVRRLEGRNRQMSAVFSTINTLVNDQMLALSDADWEELMQAPEMAEMAWGLNDRRNRSKEMLPADQEALINLLAVNGFHGWNALFNLVTGSISIEVEEDGGQKSISVAQLQQRLSHPDAKRRAYYMDVWDKVWDDNSEVIAHELNQMSGFRLSLYKARGWDDFLFETLRNNRIQKATLESLLEAIAQKRHRLVAFLQRKKELLGLEVFGWQDVDASVSGEKVMLSYDEAANFIVNNFGSLSPMMAELATTAFKDRWIESEDRPGKRNAAFCSGFPELQQSRIFVNFSGTMSSVVTLAHEIGHAYNSWVMRDVSSLARGHASTLSETASLFAEVLVSEAAIKAAKTPEERISLIEEKLDRCVFMLVNQVARFLFERSFYEERTKGEVSPTRLNELMLAAQKEAHGDALDRWHPTFWASKQHFHGTGNPFYNYPYTFGLLFASGIYAHAIKSKDTFEAAYNALLKDAGQCTAEELAMRHIGADLTKPDFWLEALDLAMSGLDDWLEMTKK